MCRMCKYLMTRCALNAVARAVDTARAVCGMRISRNYLNMISESRSAAAAAQPSGMKRQLLSG